MRTAEILVIGNEILAGMVRETNAAFLARLITGLGGSVERISVLPDRLEVLAAEFRRALEREVNLLLTTGGLGPTADDLTLEALARATSRPLTPHPEALRMVEERYRELHLKGLVDSPELTPSRAKMANLPLGAEPIPNPVGGAPAVRLQEGKSTVVCLPGVPAEMRAIAEGPLAPVLVAVLGAGAYLEKTLVLGVTDESAVASLVDSVAASHPDVYVKSRAARFGPEGRIRVTLAARGKGPGEVEGKLGPALAHLLSLLKEAGIQATEEGSSPEDLG